MRFFAVLLLAIAALAFADTTTSSTSVEPTTVTLISTSFTVSESTSAVITSSASTPVTKSVSAETTHTTSYTVSASETQTASNTQSVSSSEQHTSSVVVTTGITGSASATSSTTGSEIITATKTQAGPTNPPAIPNISGTWTVSDIHCPAGIAVFDNTYVVSQINNSFYEFTPVDSKFAGGLVEEYTNGSFVGVSSALSFCHGNANANTGNIICVVPVPNNLPAVCTANLTLKVTTTSSFSASSTYSVGPTSTAPAFTDISGNWKVSNPNCVVTAFDSEYEVTKINNTAYVFTPKDTTNFSGGLVIEYDAQSFIGVSSSLVGCKGKIINSESAKLSCLVNKATCTADLSREQTTTSTVSASYTVSTTSDDSNSASTIAVSFVLLAAIALF